MQDKKPTLAGKKDLIWLAALLVLAGGFWLWQQSKPAAVQATVTFAQEALGETHTLPLEKDAVYYYDGSNDIRVTLRVEGGEIWFEDPQCPDHLCAGFGHLSQEGEYAICMPAGVSVNILPPQ